MFQIADGRGSFYQWDKDRKIVVSDSTISQVHFCNKTDDCSLVVEVNNSIANVPNILLQNDFPIRVYAYCSDGYTKVEKVFKVLGRSKPSDYIYEETEVKTVETIEKRMDELEESLSTNIDKTVNDYLKDNPIHVDLTGYATEDYVQEAIESIEIPSVDLTGYALKTDIPTKVSSLQNDSNFVSKTYVDEAVKDVDVDLSGYATEQWVKNQGYIASIPSEYITENELNAKNYVQGSALNSYALKSELPTKVSELQNDSGYLTQHQDLTQYAKKADIPTVPDNVSAFNNDAKYATESHVATKIAEAQLGGGDVDLSEYYTKDEVDVLIPDVSGFISEIPSEYITETELNAKGYAQTYLLDAYAYRSEIPKNVSELTNDKGYVVNSDLDDYASRQALETLQTEVTDLPTRGYVDNAVSSKAEASEIGRLEGQIDNVAKNLSGYVPLQNGKIPDQYIPAHINDVIIGKYSYGRFEVKNYYNEAVNFEDIDDDGYLTNPRKGVLYISDEGDSSPQAPKVYLWDGGKFCEIGGSGGGSNIDIPGGYGFVYRSGEDYFDVREGELLPTDTRYADYEGKIMKYVNGSWKAMTIEEAIGDIGGSNTNDSFFLNFSDATTTHHTPATESMIQFAEHFVSTNGNACAYMRDTKDDTANIYYPALVQKSSDTNLSLMRASLNLNKVAVGNAIAWDVIKLIKEDNNWYYYKLGDDTFKFADADNTYTKEEIDALFANIRTAEGGSY